MNATITQEIPYQTKRVPMFTVKPVEKWLSAARRRPLPTMLFGEFWLEGELALVYGGCGAGKSILAMQIAESIATGRGVGPLAMNATPGNVLYLDFEMSEKQFEMRYAGDAEAGRKYLKDHYKFPKNRVFRAEVDLSGDMPEDCRTVEDCIDRMLREELSKRDYKAIMIDDVTFLRKANGHVASMLGLMRRLRRLKAEFGVSVLIVASSRSRREGRPMTIGDLGPGQILSRLADTVVAVAESAMDPEIRYLKQITRRNSRIVYGEGNVPAFMIEKRDGNFLSLGFDGFSGEREHFVRHSCPTIDRRAVYAQQLAALGLAQRDIADRMGISLGSANRYVHMKLGADLCPHWRAEVEAEAKAEVLGHAAVSEPVAPPNVFPDPVENIDDEPEDEYADDQFDWTEEHADEPESEHEPEPEPEPPAPWPISYLQTLRVEYDESGNQLFVEERDHLGKRKVWLKYTSNGELRRWTRDAFGTSGSAFEDKENDGSNREFDRS